MSRVGGRRMELEVSIARKALRTTSGQTRVVLHDVAFNLRKGEICALLGPSGCGKTVLLRIISGLDNDFEGRIVLPSPRRVAIARAFAVKPDLLLLDEPFVSLDASLAARLREELLALVLKRKATTLIVTHDVEEAVSIAGRIVVLSAAPGRILADRSIEAPREALTEARAIEMKEEIRSLMANASS